jgi:DNA polymerase-3 subunit delta'
MRNIILIVSLLIMQFENILGQEKHIKRFLESVENEHIAHAQHIADQGNGGAMAFALAMASYLLCNQPTENGACQNCQACRMTNQLTHPDLHFTFPIASGKNISKNELLPVFRKMMIDNPYSSYENWIQVADFSTKQAIIDIKEAQNTLKDMALRPFMGKYKIWIVWMPERMNIPAANKLLKFIEEPEGKTLLLFAGNSIEGMLPTIQSRLQQITLLPLNQEHIQQFLVNHKQVNDQLAKEISHLSDGNIALAIQWLEQSESLELYSAMFVEWMRLSFAALQKRNLDKLIEWTNNTAGLGRNKMIQFLTFSSQYIRKSFLHNYLLDEIAPFELKDVHFSIDKFSPFIHAQNCLNIITEIELASKHIQQNANAKIVLLDLAFKVARNLHTKLKVEPNGM